ncbi:hypothetical protein, partial [Rathayibacter sp. SD072]|uniref:hypothetical protein n=1 Tax=Rathayibacter sp. SD072 TaxID=2781731 RepID=UPI001A97AF76
DPSASEKMQRARRRVRGMLGVARSRVEDMTGDPMQDDDHGSAPLDGLVDRLEVIEDQPLATRAASYSELQQRLRMRLEGADARR